MGGARNQDFADWIGCLQPFASIRRLTLSRLDECLYAGPATVIALPLLQVMVLERISEEWLAHVSLIDAPTLHIFAAEPFGRGLGGRLNFAGVFSIRSGGRHSLELPSGFRYSESLSQRVDHSSDIQFNASHYGLADRRLSSPSNIANPGLIRHVERHGSDPSSPTGEASELHILLPGRDRDASQATEHAWISGKCHLGNGRDVRFQRCR